MSEEDFLHATRLMLRRKSPFVYFLPWLGWLILAALAANLGMLLWNNQPVLTLGHVGKLPVLFCPVLFVLLPWLTKRKLRLQFRSTPLLSETRTLQADFTGLHFRSASASGDTQWSAYRGFLEDDGCFLLLQQGGALFVPIPKRELSEQQVDETRSTFETYLPKVRS